MDFCFQGVAPRASAYSNPRKQRARPAKELRPIGLLDLDGTPIGYLDARRSGDLSPHPDNGDYDWIRDEGPVPDRWGNFKSTAHRAVTGTQHGQQRKSRCGIASGYRDPGCRARNPHGPKRRQGAGRHRRHSDARSRHQILRRNSPAPIHGCSRPRPGLRSKSPVTTIRVAIQDPWHPRHRRSPDGGQGASFSRK